MGRVLGREQPDAAPRLVDLDPAGSVVANAAQLHRALTAIDRGEDQLAARGDRMLGLRLHRTRADRAHTLALAATPAISSPAGSAGSASQLPSGWWRAAPAT